MCLASVFNFNSPYIYRYKNCIEINVNKEVFEKNGGRISDIHGVKTCLTRKQEVTRTRVLKVLQDVQNIE